MESAADRELAEHLAGPESSSLLVRGIRLRIVQGETAPATTAAPADTQPAAPVPMLLLHGFGGNVFSFRLVLDALGRDRPVVAYDRPGFGLSERFHLAATDHLRDFGIEHVERPGLAAAGHLVRQLAEPARSFEQLPWLVHDTLSPSQMAGVVIGDRVFQRLKFKVEVFLNELGNIEHGH